MSRPTQTETSLTGIGLRSSTNGSGAVAMPAVLAAFLLLFCGAVLHAGDRLSPASPAPKKTSPKPPALNLKDSVDVNVSKDAVEVKGGGAPASESTPPDAARNTTEITADEAALDQKAHIGVFGGTVVVKNPQFTINCDKLTAFLRDSGNDAKHGDAAPAGSKAPVGAPKAPSTPAAPAGAQTETAANPKDPMGSALKRAICEGSVVIIQDRTDANGNVQHNIGRAKKAVYNSDTGDVFLYGKPEVQDGENRCIALDEKTYMILNRNGHMFVHGPNKVVVEQAPPAPAAPPPAAQGAAGAVQAESTTASRNAR